MTVTWRELRAHHVTLKPASACVGLVSLVSSVMSALLATTRRSRPARSATPATPSGPKMSPTSNVLPRGWEPSSLTMVTTCDPEVVATGNGCWRCTPKWKVSPTWRDFPCWRWRRWRNCVWRSGTLLFYNKICRFTTWHKVKLSEWMKTLSKCRRECSFNLLLVFLHYHEVTNCVCS